MFFRLPEQFCCGWFYLAFSLQPSHKGKDKTLSKGNIGISNCEKAACMLIKLFFLYHIDIFIFIQPHIRFSFLWVVNKKYLKVESSRKWWKMLQEGWTSKGGWGTKSSLWKEWSPEWKDYGCFVSVGLTFLYFELTKFKGWLPSPKLKPTFTFIGSDFAILNTFSWQNPYQETWKLVLGLH